MTDQETAGIMGKLDAFEVAFKIEQLSAQTATKMVSYEFLRQKIEEIMEQTMSVMSRGADELFSRPENRRAYYTSFEEQMRQIGLIPKGVSHIPQAQTVLDAR